MSSTSPIALPSANDGIHNIPMSSGSFISPDLPASYHRMTPLSWREGSFGSRFYPQGSPSHLTGPLDPSVIRPGTSLEGDHTSFIYNGGWDREQQVCRDFTCCGLQLNDMHALVEHFESKHVSILPPHVQLPQQIHAYVQAMAMQHQGHYPAGPSTVASTSASSSYDSNNAASTSQGPYPMDGRLQYPSHDGAVFEADEMEMEMDSPPPPPSHSYSPSPPSSSSSAPSTPVASYAVEHTSLNPQAQQPFSAFDNHHVVSASSNRLFGFHPAATANKLSMHGYQLAAHGMEDEYSHQHKVDMDPQGIVPALLQGGSAPTTRVGTPMSSQARRYPQGHSVSQPPSPNGSSSKTHSGHSGSSAASIARSASTTLSRPAASLLIPKPFRCPKPNCSKSYKQANGLKYHMTHGSCSFAPARDIEEVQALLASKRLAAAGSASAPTSPLDDNSVESLNASMAALSEADLRDLSMEAERRLRPFACGVGQCTRRYKNMNGLRYHYSHSGEHGAIGLALLANGQHECLRQNNGHSRYAASRERSMASVSVASTTASMPTSGRGSPVMESENGSDVSTPTTPMQQQYQYHQPQRSPSLPVQPQSPYEAQMQAYSQQQQQEAMSSHMQDQQQMAYMQQQYAQQQQYATGQQQAHMYGSMSP